MSVIYPGNYVARLNAYRNQACEALPGVDFYQLVGVAMIDSTTTGTIALEILSPDLRQDDKPRLDKPFVIPEGAGIYRSAIRCVNLTGSSGDTVAVDGITKAATETCPADGNYGEGSVTAFDFTTVGTRLASDTPVTAVADGNLDVRNLKDQAAVIVEVDFFLDHEAPKMEDCNIPFKVEAGQGT